MNDVTFADPGETAGQLLWRLHKLWERERQASLRHLDLTMLQFALLASVARLERQGEAVTQQRLVDATGIDKATVSNTVPELVRKGLVRRTNHPGDGRAYALKVTPSGQQTVKDAATVATRSAAEFFAPLGRRLDDFVEALSLLVNRWQDGQPPAC